MSENEEKLKKPRRRRREFRPEFKAVAVKLVRDGGKTTTQVAQDLDLTESALRFWVQHSKADRGEVKPGALTTAEREALSRVGPWAQLRVKDGGRGIAPEDQQRIFRKFERAVGGHEVSGLGLGLFIVHELVELHEGSIRVESQPGQGATFIVELPGNELP